MERRGGGVDCPMGAFPKPRDGGTIEGCGHYRPSRRYRPLCSRLGQRGNWGVVHAGGHPRT